MQVLKLKLFVLGRATDALAVTVHRKVVVLLAAMWVQLVRVATAICERNEWPRRTHDVRSPPDVKHLLRLKRHSEESVPLTFLA
jgi:hypothetical protein